MIVKSHSDVKMANYLVENRPKMTVDETRLFLTLVAAVNKDDMELNTLNIPVSEFAELWSVDPDGAYSRLKNALRGLRSKEFFVEGINPKTGKLRFLTTSYITTAVYEEGYAYAIAKISDEFKPYLLALKKTYTSYVLQNVMNLSSVNAIRNYELLKQFEPIGQRTFSIDDYKMKLRLDGKYARNTDLRVFVVEPAVKEINENTDLNVSYEFIGRGQRAKLKFTIRKQQLRIREELPGQIELEQSPEIPWYDDIKDGQPDQLQYLSGAVGNEFSREEMNEIFTLISGMVCDPHPAGEIGAKFEYLAQQYAALVVQATKQNIPHRHGYLKKIIKNDLESKKSQPELSPKAAASYDLEEAEKYDIFENVNFADEEEGCR